MSSPPSLFDACLDSILRCSSLFAQVCEDASIGQYLLYAALEKLVCGERDSDIMVHKLIEKWPHSQLSFDFKENLLVRERPILRKATASQLKRCLEPFEYYGLRGVSKSRYSRCASGIAVGLFNHVYHRDRVDSQGSIRLASVDLSAIQFTGEIRWDRGEVPVEVFYNLSQGKFPGRDLYECHGPNGLLFLGREKPSLRNASDKSPIKVFVNFRMDSSDMVEHFSSSSLLSTRYTLKLRALDISQMKDSCPSLHRLDLSDLETLIVSGSCSLKNDEVIGLPANLWICMNNNDTTLLSQALSVSKNLKSLLLSVNQSSCVAALELISKMASKLEALCLIGGGANSDSYSHLQKCLVNLSSSLEYLQLASWRATTLSSETLGVCSVLRVLSITENFSFFCAEESMTLRQVFKMLGSLDKLEYLELELLVDMYAPDLVEMKEVLHKSLVHLKHWHMNVPYLILKRADLDVKSNSSVHQIIRNFLTMKPSGHSLLYRSSETFSIGQKTPACILLQRWLTFLRPEVCFKLGVEVNYTSSLMYYKNL